MNEKILNVLLWLVALAVLLVAAAEILSRITALKIQRAILKALSNEQGNNPHNP